MEPFQFPMVTLANYYHRVTWVKQYYLFRVGRPGVLVQYLDCPNIDSTCHSVSRILEVEALKATPFLQGAVHHLVLGFSLRRINGPLQEDPTPR
jgi:hypothetical protein